jgi:hypothetical protein
MNQPPRGSNQAHDMVYVKSIKAKYEASLLRHPHVVGVGIGLAPATPAVTERSLTLVVNVDAEVAISELPKELEGVPVTVKTTGEFKAH